ncbi:unnamed protein product [Lupinus luteus]|uniref:Uncharacterized protein n=1 Tax=Lupinus luteus TaxID=3873 RepID=A0AAV1VR56_LUPLU
MENISQVSNINDISAKEGKSISSTNTCARVENEIKLIEKAMEKGLVYLVGEAETVLTCTNPSFSKFQLGWAKINNNLINLTYFGPFCSFCSLQHLAWQAWLGTPFVENNNYQVGIR